ncbi:MAG: hypothetical protein ACI94Z_000001 [Yoonia sp.]|jgi:hypothetical protein
MLEMIRRKLLILIYIISFPLYGCLPINNGPKGGLTKIIDGNDIESTQIYRKQISKLSDWIDTAKEYDNSGDYFIFQNDLFAEMYQNPNLHLELSKDYILDETNSVSKRKLVIRMLQCLSIDDYLALGFQIVKLGDERISTTYLSPGPQYGYLIDGNYQDEKQKALLELFAAKQPMLKETIELIESGSNIKRYNELREFGEHLPVLKCTNNKSEQI